MTTEEENDRLYLLDRKDNIQRYLDTGDIGSRIMTHAGLAMSCADTGWSGRRRPAVDKFEQKWIDVYAEINSAVNAIAFKGKEWELTYWMGFCPEDVKALLKLRREWNHFDWENETEGRKKFLRSLWNPDYEDEKWRKGWQPYIDRRDKEPLCENYEGAVSAETKHTKIMMGASAGRVLLTIRDRYNKGDPEGIYGGAWVTLIFDQDSPYPRGGFQGLCASREEGLGLLQEAIDYAPTLVRDDEISIA